MSDSINGTREIKVQILATGDKGDPGIQGPPGEKGDQGPQGPQGLKGDDGYTPIKGVDYFDGKDGEYVKIEHFNIIPKVFISIDSFNFWGGKEDVRTGELEYNDGTTKFKSCIKIKPQGTSSLTYSKKNFTIDMYTDKTFAIKNNINFNDWGPQNKYCLKANWVDPTHSCNIVSANLAQQMQAKYNILNNAPKNGLIDGFPVIIYVNGVSIGIYTWNIPKSGWQFGMDKSNPNHILMCNESQTGSGAFRSLAIDSEWTVEHGINEQSTYDKFNRMISFVKDSSDQDFKTNFSEYLNLDACLNYYCFAYLSAASDNLAKNMLMATYDGLVWTPSLYDLDSLFGVEWDGISLINVNFKCPEQYQCSNNLLWERLVKCFHDELQTRYFELRQDVLSMSNILKHFSDFIEKIPQKYYSEEILLYPDILNLKRTYKQIGQFLSLRLSYVDYMFRSLSPIINSNYKDVIYELNEKFIGDGVSKYVDTGVKLYSNKDMEWTLCTNIDTNVISIDKVFISCFSELYPNYFGLNIRHSNDSDKIDVIIGNNYTVPVAINGRSNVTILIRKILNTYDIFADGILIKSVDSECFNYRGNLLIGCQDSGIFEKFRFSGTTVNNLIIYNKAVPDHEINNIMAFNN